MAEIKHKIAIGPSSFAEQDRDPVDLLEQHGCEIIPNPFGRRLTKEEIIVLLQDADGLIAGLEPLNREVLAGAPKLKALARVGIGMENVDQVAAAEKGIKVSNTPEGPTEAVAEMTLAALLALCRRIIPMNNQLHAGKWTKQIGMGLRGLNVLIIGFGRIGQAFASLLNPFGSNVLVCDPHVANHTIIEQGARKVELNEGLAQADVVSLHLSGKSCLLGPAEFTQIKPGAILLNSARGELVDEAALMEALDNDRVASAWFDVFRQEPYAGPLLGYPQVLLTPHVGTYTAPCRLDMETAAVRNLLRDLDMPLS